MLNFLIPVRGYNPVDNATIPEEPEVTTQSEQVTTTRKPVDEEDQNDFFIEDIALLPVIGVVLVVFIAVMAGCIHQLHKARKKNVSILNLQIG